MPAILVSLKFYPNIYKAGSIYSTFTRLNLMKNTLFYSIVLLFLACNCATKEHKPNSLFPLFIYLK